MKHKNDLTENKAKIHLTNVSAMIIEQQGRVFLDITKVSNALNLSANTVVNYKIENDVMCLRGAEFDNISEAILDELIELFRGDEHIIHRWLVTPREYFKNKSAFEVMTDNSGGKALIKDYIYKIKTGDFS